MARTLTATMIAVTTANAHGAETEQDEPMPDLEFLEFLGQFSTDAGEWIEPNFLLGEGLPELLDGPLASGIEEESANQEEVEADKQ